MDLGFVIFVEIIYAIAALILISSGLAVVFGMMRVINLAHGEFMMVGGYAAILAVHAGINIYVAMLVIAPIIVGLLGIVVEFLIIRHLYGRLIDTLLASWGLSLTLVGLATMIMGNTTQSIPTPISGFTVGDYQINGYNLFVIIVALVVLAGLYMVLAGTRAGLIARGTMQAPQMATALGYSHRRVYMITFICGSALSGLAGGILAPLVGLLPTSGGTYIAKAFITVISGGTSIVVGVFSSATLFGLITQAFSFATTPIFGEIALLVAAVLVLYMLPQGITGRFFKGRL